MRDKQQKGVALVLMALMLLVLVPVIGLGVDGGVTYMLRTKLSAAVDAAALAGARSLSSGDIQSQAANATAIAEKYFDANFLAGTWGCLNTTRFVSVGQNVTVTASVDAPLYFMGMLNQHTAHIAVTGTAKPPKPPACSAASANSSDFNGTAIKGGYIWFNANFTAKGIPSAGATVTIQNATIQFTEDKQYNLAVPNARITFSPTALCATTTFDNLTNTWNTTIPVSGSDEIFATGLSFPVPAGFVNAGGKVSGPVVWTGTFGSSAPGITINWKWGAAVYTSFSTDYNALKVLPTHSAACGCSNGDHAGTPEGTDAASGSPFKNFVIGGARGGGGSNFTGSWSGTVSVNPVCR